MNLHRSSVELQVREILRPYGAKNVLKSWTGFWKDANANGVLFSSIIWIGCSVKNSSKIKSWKIFWKWKMKLAQELFKKMLEEL